MPERRRKRSHPRGTRARATESGPAGFGAEEVPKNESEHGQEEHQHGPKHFLAGIRAALQNVDDRPDIGDENYEPEQTLVLHFLSLLAAQPL